MAISGDCTLLFLWGVSQSRCFPLICTNLVPCELVEDLLVVEA